MPRLPTELSTAFWYRVAVAHPRLAPLDYAEPYQAPDSPAEPDARALESGDWCLVPLGSRTVVGLVLSRHVQPPADLRPEQIRAIACRLPRLPPLGEATQQLYAFAATYYRKPLGAVILSALPPWLRRPATHQASRSGASPLERRMAKPARTSLGAIALEDVRTPNAQLSQADAQPHPTPQTPPLTDEQAQTLQTLSETIGPGKTPATFLLHGVTGSGKTRVYIEAMCTLWQRESSAQVLLIVPEIGLTPQLESRLAAAVPNKVMVSLHSEMPETQRAQAWLMAATGHAQLVLGTRLSVLTPLPGLRLIIVDEEHDSAFKQQEGLRYSARDLAVYRGHVVGATTILGSATPSLESLARCEEGAYRRLRMTRQATGAERAEIQLVDTLSDPAVDGLSQASRDALTMTLAEGDQALVYLNRRGWAPVLGCEACGWVHACPDCLTPMVLHRKKPSWRLICHHCARQAAMPPACPDCGASDIGPLGRGIQRLEQTLQTLFPQATILRLDRDAIGSAEMMRQALRSIAEGQPQIIIGTQMVAKGHDIARLRLVVVADTDQQLMHPDFRAQEWLLATLVQVSGRAGRHMSATARRNLSPTRYGPARVLVQTRYPNHPLFRALADGAVDRYTQQLLQERRSAGLPPYGYLAIVRLADPQQRRLQQWAERLWQNLAKWLKAQKSATGGQGTAWAEAQVYPPAPDYPERQSGRYRWHIVIEAPTRALRNALLNQTEALCDGSTPGPDYTIDVDPLSQH